MLTNNSDFAPQIISFKLIKFGWTNLEPTKVNYGKLEHLLYWLKHSDIKDVILQLIIWYGIKYWLLFLLLIHICSFLLNMYLKYLNSLNNLDWFGLVFLSTDISTWLVILLLILFDLNILQLLPSFPGFKLEEDEMD